MVTGLSEAHFSKLDDSVTSIPKSVLSQEVQLDKNSVTNLKHERKSKIYTYIYISDSIRKNMAAGFRLGSGAARIQAQLATLNAGGAPSRLPQVNGSVHGLSAGGLQGDQLSKAGGRGGLSCTHTSSQLVLSILVPNSFVIDCVC